MGANDKAEATFHPVNPWQPKPICGAHGLIFDEVVHCAISEVEHPVHVGKTRTHAVVSWPAL